MIPGELLMGDGAIELNVGRRTIILKVANSGDRPIQVGSHYHFAETNTALRFDRAAARGFRLNIPAGTAVRFEPGQERTVELAELAGARVVYGFAGDVMGRLDAPRGGKGSRAGDSRNDVAASKPPRERRSPGTADAHRAIAAKKPPRKPTVR